MYKYLRTEIQDNLKFKIWNQRDSCYITKVKLNGKVKDCIYKTMPIALAEIERLLVA